jgi:hypothetical protein
MHEYSYSSLTHESDFFGLRNLFDACRDVVARSRLNDANLVVPQAQYVRKSEQIMLETSRVVLHDVASITTATHQRK